MISSREDKVTGKDLPKVSEPVAGRLHGWASNRVAPRLVTTWPHGGRRDANPSFAEENEAQTSEEACPGSPGQQTPATLGTTGSFPLSHAAEAGGQPLTSDLPH